MNAAPPGKRYYYYYYSIFTPDRGKPDIKWPMGEGRLAKCIRKTPPVLSAILTDMIRKKLNPHFVTIPRLFGGRVLRPWDEGGREEDVRRLNCKSPGP